MSKPTGKAALFQSRARRTRDVTKIKRRIHDDDYHNGTEHRQGAREQTDPDVRTLDRSRVTHVTFSVHWWNEADRATRCSDEADADPAAGAIRAVPRRGRGAGCDRPDPSWTPAHSNGPYAAGRLRTVCPHAWRHRVYAGCWWGHRSTAASGGRTLIGLRCGRALVSPLSSLSWCSHGCKPRH